MLHRQREAALPNRNTSPIIGSHARSFTPWLQAVRAAEEETVSVRQKLKNAVKKGKAIEEQRAELQQRVQELEAAGAQARCPRGPAYAQRLRSRDLAADASVVSKAKLCCRGTGGAR